jgi:hypothetical protein
MPAVGNAAGVVAVELVPPCNVISLDTTGFIMMHAANTGALIATSDGCDITRVDCFITRTSVAIGSALPLTHPMNFAHRQSYMFTASGDGSLRAFDHDFVCYWQARVCDCGITCLAFSSDSMLHIGCDNGRLMTFNMNRAAVGWSVLMHSSKVTCIDATVQYTASIGGDGSAIICDNDGIWLYCLRCDAGWCGVKFTQAHNLATVSNSGKLQLRPMSSMPPKVASEGNAAWQHKIEINVEAGNGRCTAFDIMEDAVCGRGVAVLAIGQIGADSNVASDVTAVVVDLTSKIVVMKYRGPCSAITRIVFATGKWSLMSPTNRQESRDGSRRSPKKHGLLRSTADSESQLFNDASAAGYSETAENDHSGISCLSGVKAIVASCRDGTGKLCVQF